MRRRRPSYARSGKAAGSAQWSSATAQTSQRRPRPFTNGPTYINFQTSDEDEDRIRETYGDNFDRLVAIKKKYDPDNLFRVNRNIRPGDALSPAA